VHRLQLLKLMQELDGLPGVVAVTLKASNKLVLAKHMALALQDVALGHSKCSFTIRGSLEKPATDLRGYADNWCR
jgi:hypothetical protein